MPLPKPRDGEEIPLALLPRISQQATLGTPEKIVWSSLKQLCSRYEAHSVLHTAHQIAAKRTREAIWKNLRVYVQQAWEMYEAAEAARPTSAPLLYYYSALNLAKAVCEIKSPRFHQQPESYLHGLSWRPNQHFLVNMEREQVAATRPGVWHRLLAATTWRPAPVANPQPLRIKDLFALCPEVSIEYERAFDTPNRLLDLHEPFFVVGTNGRSIWLRFSFDREELRDARVTKPRLLAVLAAGGTQYHEVQSEDSELRTFEFKEAKRVPTSFRRPLYFIVEDDVRALNLFAHLLEDLQYSLPWTVGQPLRLSQLMVLYTLLYWLGSLVRYDPHSVLDLQDSEYWIVVDGFMSQSRIWLFELFEWELYQQETTLRSVR